MTDRPGLLPLLQGLHRTEFEIKSLEDEVRVDRLCTDLLKHLYQHLTRQAGLDLAEAGELCHGADYFLKDFIIADRNQNLFDVDAADVRSFAGHWYIIRTMEPNMIELGGILAGVTECYHFLAQQRLIPLEQAEAIAATCDERVFYAKRIETFWAIEDDGYDEWRAACPLNPQRPSR